MISWKERREKEDYTILPDANPNLICIILTNNNPITAMKLPKLSQIYTHLLAAYVASVSTFSLLQLTSDRNRPTDPLLPIYQSSSLSGGNLSGSLGSSVSGSGRATGSIIALTDQAKRALEQLKRENHAIGRPEPDGPLDSPSTPSAPISKPAAYKSPPPSTKLSAHFTVGEFTKGGTRPFPNKLVEEKCRVVAEGLELIRTDFGGFIKITSGMRSRAYNRQIGGASASQHIMQDHLSAGPSCAADFMVFGANGKQIAPSKVYQEWAPFWSQSIGGFGKYNNGTSHVDFSTPRTWYWR